MILALNELTKKFKRKNESIAAVQEVSLGVHAGEFVSIIGPSGSGKSTLFHMIAGLLRPTTGQVLLDGVHIQAANGRTCSDLRNKTVGYILQEKNLLGNFTVLENVCLPGVIGQTGDAKNIMEKAEALLKEVGIWHLQSAYPQELSGGEARRVAIARALINDAKLLIADEPTSNLDPENSEIIMKLFRKICDRGVAVLISTHDMKFLRYSDRVFSMDHGILCQEEGPAGITTG